MREAKPWVLLAAGSLATASLGYACAVGTTGDCSENGTCEPLDAAANLDAGGGGQNDSPVPPVDGGGPSDRSAEAAGNESGSDVAGDAAAETGGGGEAGMDGPGGPGDGPSGEVGPDIGPVCNAKATPSQDPCVIDELYGVFVSPNGNDANLGTRAQPVKTIGHGMDIAKTPGKRVYVCAGTYPENLAVQVSRDGAAVYGGLDCTAWSYAATNKVVVAPTVTGYALQAAGLTTGATFEDFEFDALDAVNPGESSIAVFVRTSQNVALHRVVMVAGKGQGAQGAIAADGGVVGDAGGAGTGGGGDAGVASNHFAGVLDGISALTAAGAAGTMCTCPDGTSSTGGQGGTMPMMMSTGQTPAPGLPSYGVAGAGAPGFNNATCGAGGIAQNGADGPQSAADTPSTIFGLLSASGWAPSGGTVGSDGEPGQGGGGGGDGTGGGGGPSAGGGGACGGCGGAGGKAGGGGGASIALLMYQSAVALVGCTLDTHDAGNGGPAASGEVGQGGGFGGQGLRGGCQGGGGGNGSGGNGGQGGPGGLSLGIGWQSTSPQVDGAYVTSASTLVNVTLGKAGTGGARGTAGAAPFGTTGRAGNDGATGKDGTAVAVMGL